MNFMSMLLRRRNNKNKMKNRQKLVDIEFERLGVKPWVYHFRGPMVYPFTAITIAAGSKQNWKELCEYIEAVIMEAHDPGRATQILNYLTKNGDGVAICDLRDSFNRKIGRDRAKGRLLQILLRRKRMGQDA